MNNQPILDTIDPEVIDGLVTRREAILRGAGVSGVVMAGLAMGSIPVALAALSREAKAQSTTDIAGVLQFALTLELLESEFYKAVLGNSSAAQNTAFATVRAALTTPERNALEQISKHENAHVAFLKATLQGAPFNATPVNLGPENFDFTGGNGSGTGPFQSATTDKAVLFAAAQAFEDTGVRAYKGQAGNLISNGAILQAALQIHSVEARHAAQIRRLRGVKSWIENTSSGITAPNSQAAAAITLVYAGEDNKVHATKDVSGLGAGNGGDAAVTAAFDEPLTREQVIAIVKDFIYGNPDPVA